MGDARPGDRPEGANARAGDPGGATHGARDDREVRAGDGAPAAARDAPGRGATTMREGRNGSGSGWTRSGARDGSTSRNGSRTRTVAGRAEGSTAGWESRAGGDARPCSTPPTAISRGRQNGSPPSRSAAGTERDAGRASPDHASDVLGPGRYMNGEPNRRDAADPVAGAMDGRGAGAHPACGGGAQPRGRRMDQLAGRTVMPARHEPDGAPAPGP